MTGVWTSRSNAFYYTGLTSYQLDKLLQKCKRKGEGKKKQWFIPAQYLTQQSKQDLILSQEENDDILDQLATNVDFSGDEDDPQMKQLNKQWKKAKIANTKKNTEVQQQRLQRRKLELYNQWSERFYEVFADNFGKMKNCLVSMHLNQQQISVFNQTLDNCLNNMQLALSDIWLEFARGEEDAKAEED